MTVWFLDGRPIVPSDIDRHVAELVEHDLHRVEWDSRTLFGHTARTAWLLADARQRNERGVR